MSTWCPCCFKKISDKELRLDDFDRAKYDHAKNGECDGEPTNREKEDLLLQIADLKKEMDTILSVAHYTHYKYYDLLRKQRLEKTNEKRKDGNEERP